MSKQICLLDRLEDFINDYLPNVKGLSANTVKSYKDTFRLMIIYFEDKKKSTIADIENIASSLVPGQNIVINSNVGTINDKNNIFKNKEAIKDYEYSAVTEAIRKLHDNKFYDVVSGKISTAEDILAKSLENNDSSVLLGFCFIIFFSATSNERATSCNPSVIILSHNN